jgi:hypothetical protein
MAEPTTSSNASSTGATQVKPGIFVSTTSASIFTTYKKK